MANIHDDIDGLLAAELHNQLSEEERRNLHNHLVECAACRQAHRENQAVGKVLEDFASEEKPDARFEQRMLVGFRKRASHRKSLINAVMLAMHWRAARIAVAIGLVILLIAIGRWLTSPSYVFAMLGNEELAVTAVSAGPPAGSFAELRQRLAGREMQSDSRYRAILDSSRRIALPSQSGSEQTEQSPVLDLHRDLVEKASTSSADEGETKAGATGTAEASRVIVTGSNIPTAEEVGPNPSPTETPLPALANRKLIRNATVDVEVASFEDALQKIAALTNQSGGYVATTSSEKQANGKLKGEIVVKVVPENLDRFLQSVRSLGELKNQTVGTEDITKSYFDTDARLKNARVMEQRLGDMLKRKSDDINDLLQVEKELARVRQEIEQMQGDLKYWDSQVRFATVTITLSEKDLEEPAAFLLKEHADLALYTAAVEKVYADIKALASPKVQITEAELDHDNNGKVSAKVTVLIAPEESERVINTVKAMGRVENFQVRTEREAQEGDGMSETAKTKRDKVELAVSISRDEQEQAVQQTTLRVRTGSVDDKARQLRDLVGKQGGHIRTSSFSRDPNGRESANVSLRLPLKNYSPLMQSLNSLGKVEDVSVQRQDRPDMQADDPNAPADISIQIYSQGNLVSQDSGLLATLRNTIGQGAAALMWSLRMVAVAIAFLLPWAIAIVIVVALARRRRRIKAQS
jgi:hypothetical protein